MENYFLEQDIEELQYAGRVAFLRAREFYGAVAFVVFALPASAAIAFICAGYDGADKVGIVVMMVAACTGAIAMGLWAVRDTWRALRAARWRVETLSKRINETI